MRTAILINCGAAEDVRALLDLHDRPNVRVVILDSHRPICHLNNVDDAADCVAVLLDEAEGTDKADIPLADGDDGGVADQGTRALPCLGERMEHGPVWGSEALKEEGCEVAGGMNMAAWNWVCREPSQAFVQAARLMRVPHTRAVGRGGRPIIRRVMGRGRG